MIGLVALAWARPLDLATPLPPCSDGEGLQLQLGQFVFGLAFHPVSGDLIVVDWGGLTVQDPQTLQIEQRWLPGINGWFDLSSSAGVGEGPPDTLTIDNALGLSVSVDMRRIAPIRVHRERDEQFQEPGPLTGLANTKIGWPPEVMLEDGTFYRWENGALGSEIFRPADEPTRRQRLAPPGQDLFDSWFGRSEAAHTEVTAAAVDPQRRRLAVATTRLLSVVDLDTGAVLASRPLLDHADAATLLDDRLATVADGALTLWSSEGLPVWTAPGTWVSAVALGRGKLIASGLDGQLTTFDLRRDKQRNNACPSLACGQRVPTPERIPAPPSSPDEATLEAWRAAVLDSYERSLKLLDLLDGRPTTLMSAGRWLVAAEVEPGPWRERALLIPRRLYVLDQRGQRVLAQRDLESPPTSGPRFVPPDTIVVGDSAYRLPDLTPLPAIPRPADGIAEVLIDTARRFDQVVVGRWLYTRFVGLQGLPPRWVPQVRTESFAVSGEDRFVLASHGVDTYEMSGAVEVWCVPPQAGKSAAPGVLASVPDGMEQEVNNRRSKAPERSQRAPKVDSSIARTVAPLTDGDPRVYAGPEIRIWADRPAATPQSILPLVDQGARVRLMLPYPPQPGESVPQGIGWGVSADWSYRSGAEIVVADTVIWQGPIAAVPTSLLALGPPLDGPVSDEALAAFRARGAGRTFEANYEQEIKAALQAGHLDVARQFASALPLKPGGYSRYARLALAIGQMLPSNVQWAGEPPPRAPSVVAVAPQHPWEVAETLPIDLSVVVLVSSASTVEHIPRGLFTGIWPEKDRSLLVDPDTWMVVDAGGVILWAGASTEVRDAALRLLPQGD